MAALTRYANTELLTLPDCGGLLENGKCDWLNITTCIGGKCSYYRQANGNSRTKSQERLRFLDEETQAHIAQKYYGGFRPWMENGAKSWR